MIIEDKKLIVDEPLENEQLDEFIEKLKNEDIDKIVIENPQLASSIIQAILCHSKDMDIECEDSFLNKVFSNVALNMEN